MTATTLPRLPADVFVASTAADRQAMATASGEPIPVLYGTQRLGASLFAIRILGNDLVLGCGWCLGPVDSIADLTINGQPPPAGVTVTHYLGTSVQAVDPTLASAIDGYADTLRMTVRGQTVAIAYSVVRIPKGRISGRPHIEAIVTSAPLAGGASPSDAGLAIADFLSSPVYGRGLTVDPASVTAVSAACNELLGDGQPRREINLLIDQPLPVAQWADILRTYAGCLIAETGDSVRLVPDRPAAPVAALTETDIRAGTLELTRRPLRAAPTVVTVSYTDTSATPWRTARATAYADGVLAGTAPWREETVALPGITRYAQAYREAVERLNSGLIIDLDASWSAFDEAVRFERGDVVTLTHSVGLTAKPFRILDIEREEAGRWRITAAEYSAAVYSEFASIGFLPDTGLPSPAQIGELQSLSAASGTAHLLALADGTIMSRMLVSYAPANDLYYDRAEIEYRRSGDADWTPAAPAAGDAAYCAPVEDGTSYIVRGRAVNSFGRRSDWSEIAHTVVGKTEPPPPPTNFLIDRYPDGTRRYTWKAPNPMPLDVKTGGGFMIRYRIGTGHVWADMTPLHDGALTHSPHESNQLAAGTYTFAICTVDSSGHLSTPVYIVADLGDPRLAGALDVQQSHIDGWAGTKTNCWVDPSTGWLVATDGKTWASFASDGVNWSAWSTWARSPNTLQYITVPIDVGLIARFSPLISGDYDGAPTIEISTSNDGSTWSGWALPTGQVTARHVRARVTLAPISGNVPILRSLTIILDSSVLSEDISDLMTSTLTGAYRIGVGDIRLPITEAYGAIRKVEIALQNTGPGWSWEVIDKDTTIGPRIKIYNGSNALADAMIDATVRGL